MNGDRADKVPQESESLPLDAVIERYWTYLRIARGLSQNTLLAYQRDVTTFQRYLRDQGLHEAQEVSPPLLADFLQHLHRSGL
ncbi:MAG TPA: site-specific integrase, partial [Nitrospira sp.]|nr:site-specific integrase [Nitrospira sp.]